MFTLSLLVLCFCLAVPRGVAATSLALYSDSSCTTVTNNLAALDGYPDGQCTGIADLSGGDTYNSLKFLTLDAGCASTSRAHPHTPIPGKRTGESLLDLHTCAVL